MHILSRALHILSRADDIRPYGAMIYRLATMLYALRALCRRHKLHIFRARTCRACFVRALTRSAAPPLPKKSADFSGTLNFTAVIFAVGKLRGCSASVNMRNAGVRVSGGDLCRKAEAPTEPTGETGVPYRREDCQFACIMKKET